jgi:hypothetical protein
MVLAKTSNCNQRSPQGALIWAEGIETSSLSFMMACFVRLFSGYSAFFSGLPCASVFSSARVSRKNVGFLAPPKGRHSTFFA